MSNQGFVDYSILHTIKVWYYQYSENPGDLPFLSKTKNLEVTKVQMDNGGVEGLQSQLPLHLAA